MRCKNEPAGRELGDINQRRVEQFFRDHLCATNVECSKALGLGVMAVGRHVKTIRQTWLDKSKRDWMYI
jgi:hypothetical protein